MIKESEAKEKWCPFYEKENRNAKCITSKCMAWRWTKKGQDEKFEFTETSLTGDPNIPVHWGWKQKEVKSNSIIWMRKNTSFVEGEGFCGLAGHPNLAIPTIVNVPGDISHKAAQHQISESSKNVIKTESGAELDLDLIAKLAGKK